jgi:hypothetical protein
MLRRGGSAAKWPVGSRQAAGLVLDNESAEKNCRQTLINGTTFDVLEEIDLLQRSDQPKEAA